MDTKTKIIFLAAFIVIVAIILGFSIFPVFNRAQEEPSARINIGFTSPNTSYAPDMFSFEDVTKRVEAISFDTSNGTNVTSPRNVHILYISGTNVDETGKAASWMFAVRHGNTSSVVTYDRYGESVLAWPSVLTGPEVFLDQIISPDDLFRKNSALLSGQQGSGGNVSRELTLDGSNYTISLTTLGKTRILQFDAKSGALTSTE